MQTGHRNSIRSLVWIPALLLLAASCGNYPVQKQKQDTGYHWDYVVVKPGTHPGIIFSAQELPALRARAAGQGMAADAWAEIEQEAAREYDTGLTVKQAVGREGWRLSHQLECMALVYQVKGDEATGRKAIEIFDAIATGIDPWAFYKEVDSDFFATEHWPKAFAFAWDWLYPLMSEQERAKILAGLEEWNAALYDHTESWWWRDAGYNCGAIPVGAQGMLLTAIQAECKNPNFKLWFSDCWRKVTMNYFPQTWDDNGICNEGPGYAHYHKNPTQFEEAVRRTGGPDLIAQSGAVHAMHYLRHQWMPQGGCGPVADNTEYGRRVFQAIYLHGIRETGDAAGLWTFEKYTDRRRYNDVLVFLLYPDGLEPVSPGTQDLRTSYYFDIDHNRAGHLFSRSEWDNEQTNWFVFTTQFESANHTHTDMNSFLFTAFGEPFATHENLFSYSDPNHGADLEHNIVIIDQGGMPANDNHGSAGDDGDINGFLTGVGTGHFADYVRGDARLSYADRSVPSTTGAVRADRMMIFAKQGPNPYVVVADDIQKDGREHDYHWQWYSEVQEATGDGTFASPLLLEGERSNCAIAFYQPAQPEYEFSVATGGSSRRPYHLGLLRVDRRGVRVRYLAVAAAWRKGESRPRLQRGPAVEGSPDAASMVVEGEGYRDLILWQPEELIDNPGRELTCGDMVTDALLSMVRVDETGHVIGYIMGDGSRLEWATETLAESDRQFSVSADAKRTVATGPRRARQGLDPLPVVGTFWLPDPQSEVWVDGEQEEPMMGSGRMAIIDSARSR